MQSIKRSWERAELLLETARQRPNKIRFLSSTTGQSKWKSIHQKLTDLYIEECSREPKQKYLRNASHLLDKLVVREKISCLVVNLYPGNDGYSVMLKGRNGIDTETVRLPYEETELLQYIDNEELPPILVDILECSQINIFYSGCVVAEVRDYRRAFSPNIYESHYVLLRPSTQTLICDVNSMTSDGSKWTQEDKMALESHLLLATQEPLCLEPSVTVSLVANYLQHSKHKFGITPIKNMAKHFSQAAINRKWKFEQHTAPPSLKLHDFLAKHKDMKRNQPVVNLRLGKPNVDIWNPNEVQLSPPEQLEIANYALAHPKPLHITENISDFVEEYTLESKQGNGKGYYCRLTIFLRSLDDTFLGELYTDRDYVEGQMKGAMCRFELGDRANVDKYLHQFIEIFTQESRKAVKITHEVKGQGSSITTVPGGQSISFPLVHTASLFTGDVISGQASKKQISSKISHSPNTTSTNSSPQPSIQVPVTSSSVNTSTTSSQNSCGRSSNRQNIPNQRSQSRSSSVSPGPTVMSPGHTNSQLTAVQTQSKSAPTPPPSSRTPTPTPASQPPLIQNLSKTVPTPPPVNLVSTPSPPSAISNVRRSQSTDVVPSIGLLSRIQPGLTGFISSVTDPGATLTSVSLTGMTVPQGIAVPISLAMMASNQSNLITTPAGVIVSPLSNLVTHTSGSSSLPSGSLSPSNTSTVSATLTATNTVSSSALMVTTGMSPASSVLTAPAGMVSFPVGITGGLSAQNLTARLITSNLKGPSVGLPSSGTSPLGLLQVTGSHPTTPLFSTGIAQRTNVIGSKGNGTNSPHSTSASTTPPASGTTPPPQPLPPPAGIAVGSTLIPLNTQQQIQLAIQNQQIASLQLQQLRQQGSSQMPKSKSRKRGGTTPPK